MTATACEAFEPIRPIIERGPSSAVHASDARGDGSDELDSQSLFAGSRRRVIVHQGERYCLQVTRAGKLLLTK